MEISRHTLLRPKTKSIWKLRLEKWESDWKKKHQSEINHEHDCVKEDCGHISKRVLEYISESPKRIFGCNISGKTHNCTEETCKKSVIIKDGEYRCYFSGTPINDEKFLTDSWKSACLANRDPHLGLIPSDNTVCNRDCKPYFQVISVTKKYYGCTKCVHIHLCIKDEYCTRYFIDSPNGDVFCIVSGRRILDSEIILSYFSEKWLNTFTNGFPESMMTHACDHDCSLNGDIDIISCKYNIYGCRKSGYIHVCHVDHKCSKLLLTNEGIYVCLFSGRTVDVYLSASTFGTFHEQITHNNRLPTLYSECDMDQENEDEFENEANEIVIDEEEHRHSDLEDASQNTEENKKNPSQDNNPTLQDLANATAYLKIEGWTPTEAIAESNTEPFQRINKLNSVERIVPDNEPKKTSSPMVAVILTKKPKNEKEKSKNKQTQKSKKLNNTRTADATTILQNLLWESEKKEKIKYQTIVIANRVAKDEIIKRIKDALINEKRLPIQPELDSIWYHHHNSQEILHFSHYDKDKCNYYIDICFKLWKKITTTAYYKQYHSQFHWKHHVIGTMYILKDGYSLNDFNNNRSIVIVESDPYIKKYIAHESIIQQIDPKLTKNTITTGKNNIKSAINSIPISTKQDFEDLANQLKEILSPTNI